MQGFEIQIGPASWTAVTRNRLSFRFFKLPKPKILNFQWTFRTAVKPLGFQNWTWVWRFPKNHKTLLKIISNIRSSQKKKKRKQVKKKEIEDYGRKATNLLLASAYAFAFASSLFVEKLWKETVVCLKIVEEITEGERGRGYRGKLKE